MGVVVGVGNCWRSVQQKFRRFILLETVGLNINYGQICVGRVHLEI